MQIVTSWERQGIAKGAEKGRQEGRQEQASSLVLRQLKRKFGKVSKSIEQTITTLSMVSDRPKVNDRLNDSGEALLDFSAEADLRAWLS
jgi:predicted transposase YdaD